MAAIYVGVNNKARKVSKIYVGVNNKARKVSKVYVGVNNKARLCYQSEPSLMKYNGQLSLSQARNSLGATSVGDYAIFGGGNSSAYTMVDAYNSSLSRTNPTSLTVGSIRTAASNSNYALFTDGYNYSASNAVNAYNTSLVRSIPTVLSQTRSGIGGASIGDNILFAGGTYTERYINYISNIVDIYNISLTRSTTNLFMSCRSMIGAKNTTYAFFCGGASTSYYTEGVYTFNSSLSQSVVSMSIARGDMAASNIDKYMLVGGGLDGNNNYLNIVDCFDNSLTRTNPNNLFLTRNSLAATNIGNYLLFGGGYNPSSTPSSISMVDVYNSSLVHSNTTNLDGTRSLLSATNNSKYALFAGGLEYPYSSGNAQDKADVYAYYVG